METKDEYTCLKCK